jgi:hypothetical protein
LVAPMLTERCDRCEHGTPLHASWRSKAGRVVFVLCADCVRVQENEIIDRFLARVTHGHVDLREQLRRVMDTKEADHA